MATIDPQKIVSSDSTADAATQPATMLAVLFADVVGSTKLYDTLGDEQAKQMIDECLVALRGVIARYGGRVIKTIGDEIMCVLPSADNACLAATDMHLKIMALPMVSQVKRSIRVGFHFGHVIEENNDVFGDTVNMAARMAGLAKGMQIMTTESTVACMSPVLRLSTRRIAALAIKGKGDDVRVSEVIWQGGDELTMATKSIAFHAIVATLHLQYGGQEMVLDQTGSLLTLGRDAQCDIVITDRNASRQHARIERRRDKFYLVDQSTNGTFLSFADEPELALHREEVMLRSSGRITFGHSDPSPETFHVLFTLRG